MSTLTLVPVEVYLKTSYRPDCDYVDGEVLERNVGELPHGRLQGYFSFLFRSHEQEWGLEAVPEQRVQINSSRFRVPDICVPDPTSSDQLIVRTPPLLCIEVLSREDRMSEMQERVEDYLSLGVRAIWVVDPWRRRAFSASPDGRLTPELKALTLAGTKVSVAVKNFLASWTVIRLPVKAVLLKVYSRRGRQSRFLSKKTTFTDANQFPSLRRIALAR